MPLAEIDLPDSGVERRPQRPAAHRRHDIDRGTGLQQVMGEPDRSDPVGPVAEIGQEEGDAERGGGEGRQRTDPVEW